MGILPHSVERLISEFSKLPSIGPKTAERLTFHLLRSGGEKQLGEAAAALREGLQYCSQCQNFSSDEICELCKDPRRDDDVWAVVSQPLDVVAVEKTGLFKGRYHVLHGVISPVDGIGPEQLRIGELMRRIEAHKPSEIILATNPNVEGETTALYLAKKIGPLGIKLTRLAHGLPIGGDLEYADQMTLGRAIDHRREF
jgi:recombination protein RecR